jgi:hypothetical protein
MDNKKYCWGRMEWLISKVSSAPSGRNYRNLVEFGPLTMCLFREKKLLKVQLEPLPGAENTLLE